MKKTMIICITWLLIATVLSGCTQEINSEISSSFAVNSFSQSIPNETKNQVKIMVPNGQEGLKMAIEQVAKWEKVSVTFESIPPNVPYQQHLMRLVETESPPVIFWAQTPEDILQVGAEKLLDYKDDEVSSTLRAISQAVPPHLSVSAENKVPGIPIGYYGQGNVVNLTILCALLGTKDKAGVQRDLVNCSWAQWEQLFEKIQLFLEKPETMHIELGGNIYTTPRYRPEEAQKLRSLFVAPTAEAAAWLQTDIEAMLNAGAINKQELEQKDNKILNDKLQPPLQAFYKTLNLETNHLAGPEGAWSRGEEFAEKSLLNSQSAEDVFIDGTVLFIKTDSKTAKKLEQNNPKLKNNIALVPVKLGYEEENITTNHNIIVNPDGYLCVTAHTQQQKEAIKLLTRLLATEDGIQQMQQHLNVLPVGNTYPVNFLNLQMFEMITTQAYYTTQSTADIAYSTGETLGIWVRSNLMMKAEWEQADNEDFIRTALEVFTSG